MIAVGLTLMAWTRCGVSIEWKRDDVMSAYIKASKKRPKTYRFSVRL